jgi:aryl-alcohol dehydrogenase-like predicted oxidoreductase
VLAAMRDLGVGLVPYSPLGRGFLTATIDVNALGDRDFRGHNPRFTGEAGAANQVIADTVSSVAPLAEDTILYLARRTNDS